MNLRKFVLEVIRESMFRGGSEIYAEVSAYSSITDKNYMIDATMEIEAYEPETREYPGNQGGSYITIDKATSEDGEIVTGEDNIRALFSEEEWVEINRELSMEFEKQDDSYEEGPDPDEKYDSRIDNINEFIQEELLKLHKTTLLEAKKSQIERELKKLED